jgi:hypothetical protein
VAEEESEAREAIRVTTAVYIANKVQNIRDDTLMRAADLSEDEAVPIAEKLQREGPQAAARMVSNAIMPVPRYRLRTGCWGSRMRACAGRCYIRCSVPIARRPLN